MKKETFFVVNEYITLKLEHRKTYIYVNDKRFLQCIRLVLNIQKEDIDQYDEIDSIDEASEIYRKHLWENIVVQGPSAVPDRHQDHSITPEQEFMAHCSNVQVWVEHEYDTRLLHCNLAFPLLKELVDVGDINAKRVFKEEIAKRFISGNNPTRIFLTLEGYLNYLESDDLRSLVEETDDFENWAWSLLLNIYGSINSIDDANTLEFLFYFKYEEKWFPLLVKLIEAGSSFFKPKFVELVFILIRNSGIFFSIQLLEDYSRYLDNNELDRLMALVVDKFRRQSPKDFEIKAFHRMLGRLAKTGNLQVVNVLKKNQISERTKYGK